ncbi:hypothetical protein EDB85DRAFT_1896037 [Lactarius pseudohatsudake]|nr:hypothetical protein EDB85DRAFT_1896037 [Lactarius pseudohatsudake]
MSGIRFMAARILLEYGADISAENDDSNTPLHLLSGIRIHNEGEARDLIRLLLEHGAAANKRDWKYQMLSLREMGLNSLKVASILLEHGVGRMENKNGKTPLHLLSESQFYNGGDVLNHARLLLEHGAETDKSNRKSLLLEMGRDWFELARILIERGAGVGANDGADKTNMVMQQDMEEVNWTQMEQKINEWFSPPDPSANYNIACDVHCGGTAAWFLKGTMFGDWLSRGSLLWIHGKRLASLAYFYFDFRDKDKKQDFRNFVTSLLIQLSAYSNLCCKIISRFYSTHGKGTQQPSNCALKDCLWEMLSVAARQPTYIIIDALDEYPNASGMPTPREVVSDLLGGLVDLDLPNLHICVTSRPESDVKRVIKSLPHHAVSLHDEDGHRKDISDYVENVVFSDRKMRKWRSDQKELVVKELSEKADGMFRWVACQLEALRRCLPASIRQTLNELPESLDETYLRVLSQIPQANQAHAHRMLQCLVVAVRPLRVEELAALLAFEFDAAHGGIPEYHADWRYEDPTEAVLSICSSLVTIVDSPWDDSQVVRFSHLSVKEFLTSYRLASAFGDISRYHISPGPAHTLLTQACLGSLLHLDHYRIDKDMEKGLPLAEYAARHWVDHAQFEDVASRVRDGMEALFDFDKPHFWAWIGIYDMDNKSFWRGSPNPLYYSVLCGFYDLVERLIRKHPQHVNRMIRICGQYKLPLLAALGEGHVEIADLLLKHGANVNVRETGVEVGQ